MNVARKLYDFKEIVIRFDGKEMTGKSEEEYILDQRLSPAAAQRIHAQLGGVELEFAFHEAAHAVTAVELGIAVQEVRMASVHVPKLNAFLQRAPLSVAMVAVAGALADAALNVDQALPADKDLEVLANALHHCPKGECERTVLERTVLERAQALLVKRWACVCEVAMMLLDRDLLGAEVMAVLARHRLWA